MPDFKISRESGVKKFEIVIAIDFDKNGEIFIQEYSNGNQWSDNLSDIRICNYYCDDETQEEWDNFLNDFLYLLESNELLPKIAKLKNKEDSYFFNEENIELKKIEEEL